MGIASFVHLSSVQKETALLVPTVVLAVQAAITTLIEQHKHVE